MQFPHPSKDKEQTLAQAAPPILPQPVVSPAEWGNFGVAIGFSLLLGNKIMSLFTQQQSIEAKMMLEYMRASDKREERLMRLVEVLMSKNP